MVEEEEFIFRSFKEVIRNLLLSVAKSKEFSEGWYQKKVKGKTIPRSKEEWKEIEEDINKKSGQIARNVLLRIKKEGRLNIDYVKNNEKRIMKIIKEEMERLKE